MVGIRIAFPVELARRHVSVQLLVCDCFAGGLEVCHVGLHYFDAFFLHFACEQITLFIGCLELRELVVVFEEVGQVLIWDIHVGAAALFAVLFECGAAT